MTYQKSKLSLLITSIILGASLQAAQAQEADDESTTSELTEVEKRQLAAEIEVISVVGTRGSIQRASQIKRTADSVIDVVTMEDIGQMPDQDVAAVIERMSGVTNNTSRGEGFQTLIRGLSADLTLTTYNGRELAGSQDGRELATGNLPSGILHRVKVIKSTTSDLIEGGMAGTIELESIKPLSLGERILSVNAKAIQSDMPSNGYVSNTGYQLGLNYFDQFNNDTLGIAATVSYGDRPMVNYETRNRTHPGNMLRNRNDPNNGFGDLNGDGIIDFIATEMHQMSDVTAKEQVGLGFAMQWRPGNDWEVNFDGLFTYDDKEGFRNWDRFRPRNQSTYSNIEFDDSAVGSASTNAGVEYNGSLVTSFDAERYEILHQNFHFNTEDQTEAYGLNVAKRFGQGWNVSVDLAHSYADDYRYNNNIQIKQREVGYSLNMLEEFPTVTNLHDSTTGNPLDLGNPVFGSNINATLRPTAYGDGYTARTDTVDSARLDFGKEIEWGMFQRLTFGMRAVEREKRRWEDDYVVTANPFCSPDDVGCDSAEVAAALAQAGSANPHAGILSGAGGFAGYDINVADIRGPIQESEYRAGDIQSNAVNGYTIDEEYLSSYLRLDFEKQIGGSFVWGNVGLRYVDTQTISTNVTDTFTVTTDDTGNIILVEVDPVDLDNINRVSYVSDYDNLLPSFNMVIEPRDDFQIRLAAGKTLSRPEFAELGASLEIDEYDPDDGDAPIDTVTASSGNPYLVAYEATQGDISVEWYPNESTALTVGYFYKSIDGFIQNDIFGITLTDQNGEEVPVVVTGVGNSDNDDTFSGWEFGYQQAFTSLPGLLQHTGIQMNYTILDSNIENERTYAFTDRDGATPNGDCTDEADASSGVICSTYYTDPSNFSEYSANAAIYYNDENLNLRVSFRKKADQVRTNRGGFGYEVGFTQVDLSASYRLNEYVRFVGAVNNLTDNTNLRYWQDPWGSASKANLQHHNQYGRRFNLGVIAKF